MPPLPSVETTIYSMIIIGAFMAIILPLLIKLNIFAKASALSAHKEEVETGLTNHRAHVEKDISDIRALILEMKIFVIQNFVGKDDLGELKIDINRRFDEMLNAIHATAKARK